MIRSFITLAAADSHPEPDPGVERRRAGITGDIGLGVATFGELGPAASAHSPKPRLLVWLKRLLITASVVGGTTCLPAAGSASAPAVRPDDQLTHLGLLAKKNAPGGDPRVQVSEADHLAAKFAAQGRFSQAGESKKLASVFAQRAGDTAAAIRLADAAIAFCSQAHDLGCEAKALNTAGITYKRKGDPEAAMSRFRESAILFARAGDPQSAAGVRLNTANVQYELGDIDGALSTYKQIETDYPDGSVRFLALRNEADLLLDVGRAADAKIAAARALAMSGAKATSFNWVVDPVCSAAEVLGRAEARLGDDRGLLRLQQCVAKAENSGARPEIHYANLAYADALIALRRPADALPFAKRALAFNDVASPRNASVTQHLAAIAYAGAGDRDAALHLAQQAFDTEQHFDQSESKAVVAAAMARTALVERESLLELVSARAAAQRAEDARRTDVIIAVAAVLVALLAATSIALLAWFRIRQSRLHDRAVTSERARVARDLHDTLLQAFTGISMQLGAVIRLPDVADNHELSTPLGAITVQARRSLEDARNAVWRMRAPLGAKSDLPALIADWLDHLRPSTTVAIELLSAPGFPRLGFERAEELFRVVQEAVTNALRHGNPTRVEIELNAVHEEVTVEVRDNGSGFVTHDRGGGLSGHWGIRGMRERAARVAGQLHVDSRLGEGTRVTASLTL
jgi:signal transduction histidine kinase